MCVRELVSKETAALHRWGLEMNAWFINRANN